MAVEKFGVHSYYFLDVKELLQRQISIDTQNNFLYELFRDHKQRSDHKALHSDNYSNLHQS